VLHGPLQQLATKNPQASPSEAQEGPLPSLQPAVLPGRPAVKNNGSSQPNRLSACMTASPRARPSKSFRG
jgi:hypothetical protein